MKRSIKIISALMCAWIVLLAYPHSTAAISDIKTITGETSRNTRYLALSDGTNTGVKYSEIFLSGYYGNDRVVNVAEGDLSNTHLSLDMINGGDYMVSTAKMSTASANYTSANEGKTVVASVNGDLYMTSVHSGSSVAKGVLAVPRGILIDDGEIWASAQIDQENLGATNNEKNQPAGLRPAFGVTNLNQPIMGAPIIELTLTVGGKTIRADGINRLPANNSIIAFNHRVYTTNYALNDSYEVVVAMDSGSAFKAGGKLSGTIEKIYESGSTTRPSLNDPNKILLTARGTRLSELKKLCYVGAKVTFSTTMVDQYGHTDLWNNVKDAIGGHMQVLYDDAGAPIPQSTLYPTTLIGYKSDGTVALVTVTSTKNNSREALKISQSYELCRELGYNSVFYLDGGGSATFVALENGKYTVRNKCSDGYERKVIGGIGFVWNDEPVCMRQGSLNHIDVSIDMSALSALHIDGAMAYDLMANPNCTNISYDRGDGAMIMSVNAVTNDPFATLNYTPLKRVEASKYPYIVLKVKSSLSVPTNFGIYYCTGSTYNPEAAKNVTTTVNGSGEQYIVFDMQNAVGWSGNINSLRLDYFNSMQCTAGSYMKIYSITLCRGQTEINAVKNGRLPSGSIENYYEYKDALRPTPYFECGDVTDDGNISITDVFRLKTLLGGFDEPSRVESYSADVDGNEKINISDFFYLKRYLTNGKWEY